MSNTNTDLPRAAAAMPDTIVAAVLRPGYSDGEDTSEGLRGLHLSGGPCEVFFLRALGALGRDLREHV